MPTNWEKAYIIIVNGTSDNNIKYTDFQNVIIGLGFEYQRQEGSHTIYRHAKHKISMNIQRDGNKQKAIK